MARLYVSETVIVYLVTCIVQYYALRPGKVSIIGYGFNLAIEGLGNAIAIFIHQTAIPTVTVGIYPIELAASNCHDTTYFIAADGHINLLS